MGGSGVVVLLLNDDTKFQKKKGAKIDRQDHRTITKTKDTCSIPLWIKQMRLIRR